MADTVTTRIGYVKGAKGDTGEKGAKGDAGGLVASGDGTVYNPTTGAVDLAPSVKNKLSAIDNSADWLKSKNLLDIRQYQHGSIDATSGQDVDAQYNSRGENYIKVKPNTVYTLSANASVSALRLSEYKSDKSVIQRTQTTDSSSHTITTSSNTTYLRWSMYTYSVELNSSTVQNYKLMLEEGGTRTEYVPYSDSNVQITQTLYSLQPMVGSSAKFKQYAQNTPFSSRDGITTSTDGNYSVLNGTSTSSSYASGWWGLNSTTVPKTKIGNKIIIGTKIISGSYSGTITFGTGKDLASIGQSLLKTLEESDYVSTNLSRFGYSANATFTNLKIVAQFFDLTEIFGKGNEPTTVEQFESMFSDAYYPYNATELPLSNLKITQALSVNTTDGFIEDNKFDGFEAVGKFINASGVISDAETMAYTKQIAVKSGLPITISYTKNGLSNDRLHEYSSNGTWLRQLALLSGEYDTQGSLIKKTYTISSDAKYIRFSTSKSLSDLKIRVCQQSNSEITEELSAMNSGWQTPSTVNGATIKYKKNMDLVSISISNVTSYTTTVDLATLPTELRPSNDIYFLLSCASITMTSLCVKSNGIIRLYANSSGTKPNDCVITYMI